MNQNLKKTIQQIQKVEQGPKKRLSQLYAGDQLVKEVLGLPVSFPLDKMAYIPHGVPNGFEQAMPKVIAHKPLDLFFVHTKDQVAFVEDHHAKAHLYGDVFMRYRHFKKWQQATDAKGTLAFPCHSTQYLESNTDWEGYAQQLLNLPEEFHPVKVCMYWKDLLKGKHQVFLDAGFEIVTAGHYNEKTFCERLYEQITSVKYVTSNEIGSYTFYTLEMGIPFFIYGPKVTFEISQEEITPRNHPDFIKTTKFLHAAFEANPHQQTIELTKKHRDILHRYVDERIEPTSPTETRKLVRKKLPGILFNKVWRQLTKRK